MVQWLGFFGLTAEVPGSIPGQGTKIPQAVQCSTAKKKKKEKCGLSIIVEYYSALKRDEVLIHATAY